MSIVVDNVSFSYDGGDRAVLRKISFRVEPGEFVALVGANGSGKSTLARLVSGLFVPESGSVKIDDYDTADDDAINLIRERTGMVFQNPENQIVATIVENDVAFAPENLAVPSEEIEDRVNRALKVVGLTRKADAAPHMLSGGQKQRLAVAGILAMHPKYVVLDEPTSMLDPAGRRDIIEVVHKMVREEGLAVFMVTHFMEEIVHADRIIVLNHGEKVQESTPDKIFSDAQRLKKWGLNPPWICSVAMELRKLGLKLPGGIMTPAELDSALSLCMADSKLKVRHGQ